MQRTIFIVCSSRTPRSDLSFAKLVDFLGIKHEFVYLEHDLRDISNLINNARVNGACLALNSNTLAAIHQNTAIADKFTSIISNNIPYTFIYGVSPTQSESDAVNYLTNGAIKSVSYFVNNDYTYEVSDNYKEICRSFSGLSFGPIDNKIDFGLCVSKQHKSIDNLISINKHPIFLRLKNGSCEVFVLATSQILDISGEIFRFNDTKEYFSRLIPATMFLKYAFKDYCWHSDKAQACLIIDDPLLRRKYGFLDYQLLLQAMDNHNFFTTVAFIPWNFRRTSKQMAKLFKERADKFSLCVHGCNHTKREFGSNDPVKIDSYIKTGVMRMKSHEALTGIGFDKVMVFPQNVYSTDSMRILKSNDFLVAINSEAPDDCSKGQIIQGTIQPANLSYENFAKLSRRLPRNTKDRILDFAFDLFMGKPLLIGVHQDYFKDGYGPITEFVERINSLTDNIQWRGLGDIARSLYLQKKEDEDVTSVRQYANNLLISNTSGNTMKYVITKEETNNIPISEVLVNGESVPYGVEEQMLNLVIDVEPGTTAVVSIVYQDIYPHRVETGSIWENLNIFIRRYASEIRDKYLSNPE